MTPSMHHLILVREIDQQMSSSGCCGRIEGDAAFWGPDGCTFPDRREKMERVGEIYRAVRGTYGDAVTITIVDPRNFVSFLPLVARDAFRFGVPIGTALRALTATSLSTAVFDGQLLYAGRIPAPAEVLGLIRDRLHIARVGDAPYEPVERLPS
ncbi:MAG TPA: hypothetical protein VMN39_07460 [Longimicrobiaceae bacterium]|nr:hypothetical protein [Longimicrobiaceae bacterium]